MLPKLSLGPKCVPKFNLGTRRNIILILGGPCPTWIFYRKQKTENNYPLITPNGFNFATLREIPAPWQTFTTMLTSL